MTVTHPEVARYFMTIPEAAQLVLQAAALGTDGQVFVLNMGNPIKSDIKTQVAGADVFFCCPKCKTAVANLERDKQVEKVFNKKTFEKSFHIAKHEK